MKKIYGLGLIAIALLLKTNMLFSQDSLTVEPEDGEKTQSIGLYPFNYIGFAYEKKIDADRSWRFYLDLDGSVFSTDDERKSTDQNPGDTTQYRYTSLNTNKDFGIELSGLHIWSIYTQKEFNIFAGVGPQVFINWYSFTNESEYFNTSGELDSKGQYDSDGLDYGVGIIGVFGAGFNLTEELSLYGEYQLKYSIVWRDINELSYRYYPGSGNEYGDITDTSGSGSEFSLSNVLVGIYYSF